MGRKIKVSSIHFSTATGMIRELLNVLRDENNKEMLDQAVKDAKGRMLAIMEDYTAKVIELCGYAIEGYGYSKDAKGVMSALAAIQEHAHREKFISNGLMEIRRVFCPTGKWIMDDEEQLKNETLRRQRIKEAQEERERSENGQMHFVEKEQRKAEARARKLQLGLNPDQVYEPIILTQPVSTCSLPGESAYFTTTCQNVFSYRWTCNGGALSDRIGYITGTRSPFLKIHKVHQGLFGQYICFAQNDDGQVSTEPCTLSNATLKLRETESKRLEGLAEAVLHCQDDDIALVSQSKLLLESGNTVARVSAVAWCTSTKILAIGDLDGCIQLWNLGHVALERKLKNYAIASIAFVDASRHLIAWDGDVRIKILDAKQLNTVRTLRLLTKPMDIAPNPMYNTLAVALSSSKGHQVRLYDLSSSIIHSVKRIFSVTRLSWNEMGTHFALAEKGVKHTSIAIVNGATREVVNQFEAHIGSISCLEWTMGSKLLVSAGQDGIIKIWGAFPKTNCLSSIQAHSKGILDISVHGSQILSISHDKMMKTWELADFQDLETQFQFRDERSAVEIQRIVRGYLVRPCPKHSTFKGLADQS